MPNRNRDWKLELCCSRTKEHAVKLLLYTDYFMAFLCFIAILTVYKIQFLGLKLP